MSTERTFPFDLRLPNTPPTEDKELYEQLQYLYRAVFILAEQYKSVTASTVASILVEGDRITITYDSGTETVTIAADPFLLSEETPATSSSPGIKGEVVYDSSYLYICVATDTWRRIPHATW